MYEGDFQIRVRFNLDTSNILTPCIGHCILYNRVCDGCHRTVEEIERWKDMTDEERKQIMRELDFINKEPKI